MFLSVITPAYNRAYTLTRCYESLLSQSCKDFEWIVVDDGSTDETQQLIQGFIRDEKLPVRYFYQENGGKHRAHNLGVKHAQGMMCLCLDSDDALSSDAVETVRALWESKEEAAAIGILAKRGNFETHQPTCAELPAGVRSCTMMGLQQDYGFSGDTALFFETKLMQQNYFREFDGEKFLPEDSLYAQLDQIGPMLLLDKVVYYSEYLADGLTARYRKLLADNPMGTAYCYYCRMCSSRSFCQKLKNAIISQSYLALTKKPATYDRTQGWLILALASLAVPLYRKKRIGR